MVNCVRAAGDELDITKCEVSDEVANHNEVVRELC